MYRSMKLEESLQDEILAKRSVRVTGEVTWWQFQQYLHNYQRLRGNANLFQNQLRQEDEMYENIITFGESSNGIKDAPSDYFTCKSLYESSRVVRVSKRRADDNNRKTVCDIRDDDNVVTVSLTKSIKASKGEEELSLELTLGLKP
ncbi:unnamed protein product [Eruca vesicaria subsp. sativa]|uniref:Uncharacterized protein n=1 Tax=Eruca vesicaria subsp. sativa TaxID=29727 RepID=A0ABC8J4P6_ERUVS|nr:unnamed protein product [Eruca vesicaria subsp. sativa]